MKDKYHILTSLFLIVSVFIYCSCGIYSFSGTSISPDIKSISIQYFPNKAETINPSLSQEFTDKLTDAYRKLTNLQILSEGGDLQVSGEIVGYTVRAAAISSGDVATQNRLTITVRVKFKNLMNKKEDFERTFSGFSDYDSSQNLSSVEASLNEEIIKQLVDNIINATIANW